MEEEKCWFKRGSAKKPSLLQLFAALLSSSLTKSPGCVRRARYIKIQIEWKTPKQNWETMGSNLTTDGVTGAPSLPSALEAGHSSHGSAIDRGTAPAFASVYSQALDRTSTLKAISSEPGHAHGLPATDPSTTQSSSRAASAGGSRHFPLKGAQQHGMGVHSVHETALALRAYRMQLLASNIANADTPGYKAVDIDVEEALRNGQSNISDIPLKYHVPAQPSIDGNTVDMDVERAKFAQNALMYEFALDRVKGHHMEMMQLLRDLKD